MAALVAHGIELDLPHGWHGRVRRRETVAVQSRVAMAPGGAPARPPVVAHAASFPLPRGIGDFGGGAVEQMTGADLFVALVEFDADSVGTSLFSRVGLPRSLRATDFGPQALQRPLPGQGGAQYFCVEAGRPLCLYVVLGSFHRRSRTIPVLNDLLQRVRFS